MYTPKESVSAILDQFRTKKILIVGDSMLDAYWYGSVSRISPEAPVPVVLINNREYRLGGAANVALNIRKMGAEVRLISTIGNDLEGEHYLELLKKVHISTEYTLTSGNRPTTVKTRVIANKQQQAIRLDSESSHFLNEQEEDSIIQLFDKSLNSTDAIIFQDYDKGVLTPKVIRYIMKSALKKGIPTLVDPKKRNFFEYNNATVFKPNLKELSEGLDMPIDKPVSKEQLQKASTLLFDKMQIKSLFITLSEEGVYINDDGQEWLLPSHKRNVYDVSGAGDTVAAIASLCLACRLPMNVMAEMANLAGGLVCEHVGVVPVEPEWILKEYKRLQDK